MASKTAETLEPASRRAWRAWLAKHHATSSGVWLVFVKGDGNLKYEDGVEEALCFGWIDSTARRVDDTRRSMWFAPRRPKSGWAKTNKARVEKLIAAGAMAAPGLAKIEAAKANGSWTALDSAEALEVPDDLAEALAANKKAKLAFDGFPPSARKLILWWIGSAKRPPTRAARIEETVRLAAEGKRARP